MNRILSAAIALVLSCLAAQAQAPLTTKPSLIDMMTANCASPQAIIGGATTPGCSDVALTTPVLACDGLTDQTSAIQAALDAFAFVALAPSTTCLVTGVSIPASHTFSIPTSATLKKYSTGSAKMITAGGNNVTILISGTIDNNNSTTFATEPIFCDTKSGLYIYGGGVGQIKNSQYYGVHAEDCSNVTVDGVKFSNIKETQVISFNNNANISNLKFVNNYCDKTTITTGTGCFSVATSVSKTVTGFLFDNNECHGDPSSSLYQDCLSVLNTSTASAMRNAVVSNNRSFDMLYGITVEGFVNSSVTGNAIKTSQTAGGYCYEIGASRNSSWAGNSCSGGTHTMLLRGGEGISVTGNSLSNSTTIGLQIVADPSGSGLKNTITGNVIKPAGGSGISLTGSNYVIDGNIIDGGGSGTNGIFLVSGGSRTITSNQVTNWSSTPITGQAATDVVCNNSTLGCNVLTSVSGYSGGELVIGGSGADLESAISTQSTGAPVMDFDHRATSNSGYWRWRNGTTAANQRMQLFGSALTIGTAGSSTGSVSMTGSTSGTATFTAQAVAGTPMITLGTSSGTLAATASSPIVLNATTGNLTCPTCVTSSGGGAITGTSPIAVSAGGVVSINDTAVTPASYGSATASPTYTVDQKGRLTAAANVTITPALGSITGLGTGVATALAINVGSAGAPVVNGGALGSPSSAGTLPALTLGGTIDGGGNPINNVIIGASTPLAGTFTIATANGFVPNSSTVLSNGMYLPAANTLGWAVSSGAEMQLTATALSPAATGGNALGTTALPWANLFLSSAGVINFGNGNYTLTHSTGLLTGSSLLRVVADSAGNAFDMAGRTADNIAIHRFLSHDTGTQYAYFQADATSSGRLQIFAGGSTSMLSMDSTGLTLSNALTFAPNLPADTATADSTVCVATTGSKLLKGTGALGVCLGTSGSQFKTAFVPMKAGLSELMQVDFQNYRYKKGFGDDGASLQYGTTAQSVETAVPDLVRHNSAGEAINFDSGALLFIGLRAIQQLKADNDDLRADVKELRRAVGK